MHFEEWLHTNAEVIKSFNVIERARLIDALVEGEHEWPDFKYLSEEEQSYCVMFVAIRHLALLRRYNQGDFDRAMRAITGINDEEPGDEDDLERFRRLIG